jgi:hypothetical protein
MEILKLINGNNQPMNKELPRIVILAQFNDIAKRHLEDNTGLVFKDCFYNSMEAQPQTSDQIVRLLLTYNFKTQYQDNATNHNTLYLKSDHHQGFHVDSICFDCIKHNNINTMGLKEGDRLAV